MRIHIVGTFDECEHAADRIARVLDARHVGRITRRDDGPYQVRIDARPRKSSRPSGPLVRRSPELIQTRRCCFDLPCIRHANTG